MSWAYVSVTGFELRKGWDCALSVFMYSFQKLPWNASEEAISENKRRTPAVSSLFEKGLLFFSLRPSTVRGRCVI